MTQNDSGRHLILVVDDGETNRDLLGDVLRDSGYDVVAVATGEEALACARAHPPSLVISDIAMPGMNGFELVRRLRSEPELPQPKVVFCSGNYDAREVREIAQALDVEGILPKPFKKRALVDAIAEILRREEKATPPAPPLDFDAKHLRVVSDKLVEKADELELTRDALRESEERFRTLVANIPGAVYRRALDENLTVDFVSDRVEDVTGYSPSSLIGSGERSYASIIHHDDLSGVADDVRAAVESGRPYGLAYRIIGADGRETWVGDKGQAVRDEDGIWLYGTLSDISERKRLEAERDHMELELRVAQKLEAVGQLAAGIAHEMNTPIQFVGDGVQFLKDSFEDLGRLLAEYRHLLADGVATVPDELRARLDRIADEIDLPYLEERVPAAFERTLDGVERVASIVRAMKEFAHPHSEQAPADLNRALATTLTVARNEYKYVAEIETAFGDLPPVVCNLSDLNQVFLNLIVNAAHAIEDRSGSDKGRIGIETRCEGDRVLITVSDTGCGIPTEIQTRIFDPFFTTKAVGRGSGQGLAIARAVVEKHGGSLEFESEVGSGTTFFIRLPVGGPQSTRELSAA
jgi:PAS domain S-box-containing protein